MDNGNALNGLASIGFENGIEGCRLVLKLADISAVVDYQLNMIKDNTIAGLLPAAFHKVRETLIISYKTDSLIPLATYLKTRMIDRTAFSGILKGLSTMMNSCRFYLLYEASLLLEEDYLFINPNNFSVYGAYIPVQLVEKAADKFKKLLSNIIMSHIEFDASISDHYLGKLLNYIKKNDFNILTLGNFIDNSALPEAIISEHEKSSPKRERNTFAGLLANLVLLILLIFFWMKLSFTGGLLPKFFFLVIITLPSEIFILRYFKFLPSTHLKKTDNGIEENLDKTTENQVKKEIITEDKSSFPNGTEKTRLLGISSCDCPLLLKICGNLMEEIRINKKVFIIGRMAEYVDCFINNPAIGRIHAELSYEDGIYHVKDLKTKNGTFINGTRLDPNSSQKLKSNDKLTFANEEYLYIEKTPVRGV